MKRLVTALTLVAVSCLSAIAVLAQPLPRDEVPEPLKPWVNWVLRGHETQLCPQFYASEQTQCVWPARLDLDLGEVHGRFTQQWLVNHESWVPLPGDEKRWPLNVKAGGRTLAVIPREGRPGVQLAEGLHTVQGEFRWDALPELLQTPRETGIVKLTLAGRPVAFPVRDAEGRLWLRKRPPKDGQAESRIEIDVHRLVTDDVPLRLLTQIVLKISGKSREVLLGRALPDGFIPLSLTGPVPARLEQDGRFRVQVRPGNWTFQLDARHDLPTDAIALPEPDGPWDPEEVWAFQSSPDLRLVQVEGPPSVDPQQTLLPGAWRSLPAYLMKPGTVMRLVEKRRGDADPAPDQLSLNRTWWLDFDGGGYTIADRISGVINRSSRLDMGPSTTLGRVSVNGTDQVITRDPSSGSVGIEVPRGTIQVEADSRREKGRRTLSAVGWKQDFDAVSGQLNLPPGWRLFHLKGADKASTTWVNRWTLLDLFMVLVISMAFVRLWGPKWGFIALVTLFLTYTERAAPGWAWVFVLVGEALRRGLPRGRFSSWVKTYWAAAVLALILNSIPFAVSQVRSALNPSLEYPQGMTAVGVLARTDKVAEQARLASGMAESRLSPRAPGEYLRQLYKMDPNARINTGPGLPSWRWRSVELSWSGPVERTQELRLFLLSPPVNRLLSLLRVALLALLLLRVLLNRASGFWRGGRATAAAGLFAVAFLLAGASPAHAELPGKDLLDELRTRLLEKPECHPSCAAIPRLHLEVKQKAYRARLQVDVQAKVAVPLPLGTGDHLPEVVLVNDRQADGLLRQGGVLWLPLAPGTYEVILKGSLPARETIEMPLPLKPHRVEATAEGWVVHGLRGDGLAEDNLQLTRISGQGDTGADTLESGSFPPFVRVVREITLGLSWQVVTRVVRVTPVDAPVVLEIPLLPGESVTSANVRAEKGRALVSMGPGVKEVSWQSLLEERRQLGLKAPRGTAWAETWRLDTSTVWHVETEGIPVIHQASPEGRRIREWRPWPGEQVALTITRPEGVPGATVTIDASEFEMRPGRRATDATLTLRLRSSQGGQHRITLPPDAALQEVRINGKEQPIRQEGREVTIPLAPGTRIAQLQWRESRGSSTLFKTFQVDIGAPSVDAEVRIRPSAGRWTLFVGGPPLGPCVLFWSLLLVVLLVALGLGRIRITPLRWRHWLLLGVGLTQVSVWEAAVVVIWLLLLGWRRERGTAVPGRWFDLVQLGLAAVTFVALAALFASVEKGLLGLPEMQIAGNGSGSLLLRWYQDRTGAELPRAWVYSVPILAYRLAMLAWALWLAQAVVRWLRWGWTCFTEGELWRPIRRGRGDSAEAPSTF